MNSFRHLFKQLFRFGIVGVICFIIDFALLHFLTEVCDVYVLVSAAISFSVSVVANYILSSYFVFDVNREKSQKKNFVLFIIFSVIGLILTEILMKVGIDLLRMNYSIVKIIATVIVMIYNFVTRKLFMEK